MDMKDIGSQRDQFQRDLDFLTSAFWFRLGEPANIGDEDTGLELAALRDGDQMVVSVIGAHGFRLFLLPFRWVVLSESGTLIASGVATRWPHFYLTQQQLQTAGKCTVRIELLPQANRDRQQRDREPVVELARTPAPKQQPEGVLESARTREPNWRPVQMNTLHFADTHSGSRIIDEFEATAQVSGQKCRVILRKTDGDLFLDFTVIPHQGHQNHVAAFCVRFGATQAAVYAGLRRNSSTGNDIGTVNLSMLLRATPETKAVYVTGIDENGVQVFDATQTAFGPADAEMLGRMRKANRQHKDVLAVFDRILASIENRS